MDAFPALRCVLQHWYELRPKGEKIGSANNQRFVDIKALHMVARRQGIDSLRGTIVAAARSERASEPAHLPIGAGLFTDDLRIETYVRRALDHQRLDYRIAATYGAIYYLRRSEEIAFILGERVLLAEEDKLLVLASRDVLDIWRETKDGGRCGRCGSKKADESWCPARVS